MRNKKRRRDFLKGFGAAVGVSLLGVSGVRLLVGRGPATAQAWPPARRPAGPRPGAIGYKTLSETVRRPLVEVPDGAAEVVASAGPAALIRGSARVGRLQLGEGPLIIHGPGHVTIRTVRAR